jgi:adenine-specific DNA-methyltransferase
LPPDIIPKIKSMASQNRTYEQQKLLGQVYTPAHIVDKILRETGYYQADLDNEIVLDPACGDGRFLVQIVAHIVSSSPFETLKTRLENVYGWDIDAAALAMCRNNLDEIISPLDISISWNLHCLNALEQKRSKVKFDYVVGNPPYIRIQHLEAAQRKYIQIQYSFCKNGATDAFVAFFQLASLLLTENGKCGFITPNSYFSSETAAVLRAYFETTKSLIRITNYGSIQVFANATTYSAVTVFTKSPRTSFIYEKFVSEFTSTSREIPFAELKNSPNWHLSASLTPPPSGTRLGDLCRISVGIATLADSYYIFKIQSEKGNECCCVSKNGDTVWLEKDILKPIIKGSRLKSSLDPIREVILFPYEKDAFSKHKIIGEDTLRKQFPKAYKYLLSIRDVLMRRDNGKPNAVAWYAFGRSQGLDTSFGKKIIFSPLNRAPNFILYENVETTVYSGYYIKYDGDYQALLAELNSERMAEYIAVAGRDFQGGYKAYNKKVLENFRIPAESVSVSE